MEISIKAIPILTVLQRLNKYYNKLYCFPSQETILKHLAEKCSVHICRRSLNYKLKAMESHGLISRIRRHRRDPEKGMEFHSTLYKIQGMGYQLMVRWGVISFGFFKGIQNALQQKVLKKKKPCANYSKTHDFSNDIKGLGSGYINTS